MPDFFAADRDHHRTPLEALAAARARSVRGIGEFEAGLGDLTSAPDVVVVALLLSYRAEGAWDRFFAVVERMRPELANHPYIRQQRAFALNRAGQSEEAERILLALRKEHGPTPETNGILGRVYKDRFMAAHAAGDADAAAGWMRRSIDTYLEGHDADPTDPYPGLNALSLMEFADPPPARRDSLLAEVSTAARRRRLAGETRFWDYATEWELALLQGDERAAGAALASAVEHVEEPWQADSTRYNTKMIQAAWAARGMTAPAWVGPLARRLDAVIPAGEPAVPRGGIRPRHWLKRFFASLGVLAVVGAAVIVGLLAFGSDDEAGDDVTETSLGATPPGTTPLSTTPSGTTPLSTTIDAPEADVPGLVFDTPILLRSVNLPDLYVRHTRCAAADVGCVTLGALGAVGADLDRSEATYLIRPGLAVGDSISFESVSVPGTFLRHEGSRVTFQEPDGSDRFDDQASFTARPGLAGAGASFESVDLPSHYLRHCDRRMLVDDVDRRTTRCNAEESAADASFEIVPDEGP